MADHNRQIFIIKNLFKVNAAILVLILPYFTKWLHESDFLTGSVIKHEKRELYPSEINT